MKVDCGMSVKEIKKHITKEERYQKRCQEKINDLRFDLSASERAKKFWEKQLKIAEKKEKNTLDK